MTTKVKSKDEWHKKIARSRGSEWRKNVLKGRREVLLSPSNIRLARIQKNIYQAVIAAKLNISESTFGDIERGHRPVKEAVANRISKLLGLPLKNLFKPGVNGKFVALISKSEI